MSLLVVLPFFYGDERLLIHNLAWMKELDGKLDYDCLLATDKLTNVDAAQKSAVDLFKSVSVFVYPLASRKTWPVPQNNAFMNVAWHISAKHKGPWIWVETDSIPTQKGWLDALWADYQKGGKPFGGHWNHATGVFNGVGIYPSDVARYSQNMMTAGLVDAKDAHGQPYQPPWDFYGSKQVKPHLHVMNHLMQHIWQNDATGEGWVFPDKATVEQVIRPGIVLFHRCKNESLVARLREMTGSKFVPRESSADVVSLRRNGDIISLLPLLKRMSAKMQRPVRLAVMREYADLLDGVSYVEAVPCDGDQESPLPVAERMNAVNAQVFGSGLFPDVQSSNFVKLAWSMVGYRWDRHAPLVFDKRDYMREEQLSSRTFKTDKPKILVKLHGHSSPFPDGEYVWNELRQIKDVELVNLDEVKAERLYDLLGLMDRAECMITVDTSTTHLAQASRCPTIQLTNNLTFGASPPRGNCILRFPYKNVRQNMSSVVGLIRLCAAQSGNDKKALVFNHWVPRDENTKRRQDAAYETWLKFPARLFAFDGKRNSEGVGDKRRMPFVRDMIQSAFSGSEDVIVISNNDIRFDGQLSDDIQQSCNKWGCWWAYRTDHAGGPTDNGADVFAFTRKWWSIHQHLFPDFLLGYWWWDDVMVRMMRWSGCAEKKRLYYHEPHPQSQAPTRQNSPGAMHNERLANEWLNKHDERREKPE